MTALELACPNARGDADDQPLFPPNLFQTSSWTLKDLKHIEEIGKGKDTVIYSATCPRLGGRTAAVKVYDRSKVAPTKLRAIKREIAMMMYFQRKRVPNVVEFYAAFEDENYYYIVMEYCPGGDLLEYLLRDRKALSERRCAVNVAIPLFTTIARIHDLNIIHRDIKLENIFLDASGRVKLGDFGLTMSMRQEAAISPVGTVEYMAPEVVALPSVEMVTSGKVRASSIPPTDSKVDIWALGVTLYELVTGKLPFEGKDKPEIKAAITSYKLSPFPCYISAQCQSMIRSMLAYKPEDRPTAANLLDHPFIKGYKNGNTPLVGSTVTLNVRAGPPPISGMNPSSVLPPQSPFTHASVTANSTINTPPGPPLAGGFSGPLAASSREVSASNLASRFNASSSSTQTGLQTRSQSFQKSDSISQTKTSTNAWAALKRLSGSVITANTNVADATQNRDQYVGTDKGVAHVVRKLFSRQSAPHKMQQQ